MKLASVKSIVVRLRRSFRRDGDGFLKEVSGVVHVGANTGQERGIYDKLSLDVIWIEPIPEVFAKLQNNLSSFPRQRAVRCLITDKDDEENELHVSNNDGLSSSILALKDHRDIWPEVTYSRTIRIMSTTLTSLFAREGIDASKYQALILDTQGTELLVLRGSIPLLKGFRYIKTEVPDFAAYAGCCLLSDVETFMGEHEYSEISRTKFAERAQGGAYYDVVYKNLGYTQTARA
jgi:FkbM family methyltransferase